MRGFHVEHSKCLNFRGEFNHKGLYGGKNAFGFSFGVSSFGVHRVVTPRLFDVIKMRVNGRPFVTPRPFRHCLNLFRYIG